MKTSAPTFVVAETYLGGNAFPEPTFIPTATGAGSFSGSGSGSGSGAGVVQSLTSSAVLLSSILFDLFCLYCCVVDVELL